VRPDHSYSTTIGRSNCRGGCCWCGENRTVYVWVGWTTRFFDPRSATFWAFLGEVGLVLLLVQAGLAMDLHVLQQVGMRAMVMPTIVDNVTAALASYGPLVRSDQCRYCPKCVAAVWCPRHSVGSTHCGHCHYRQHYRPGRLVAAPGLYRERRQRQRHLRRWNIKAAAFAVPIVGALAWLLFVGGGIALYRHAETARRSMNNEPCYSIFAGFRPKSPTTRQSRIITTGGICTTDTKHAQRTVATKITKQRKLAHVMLLLVALLTSTNYSRSSHLLGSFSSRSELVPTRWRQGWRWINN
jgi:hypothetical protein